MQTRITVQKISLFLVHLNSGLRESKVKQRIVNDCFCFLTYYLMEICKKCHRQSVQNQINIIFSESEGRQQREYYV